MIQDSTKNIGFPSLDYNPPPMNLAVGLPHIQL